MTVSVYGKAMVLSKLVDQAKKLGLHTGRIEKINKLNNEVKQLQQVSKNCAFQMRRLM